MYRSAFTQAATLLLLVCSVAAMAFGQSEQAKPFQRFQLKNPPTIVHDNMSREARKAAVLSNSQSSTSLPIWNYQVLSTRDGNIYDGVIVGADPTTQGPAASTNVRAQVIPLILKFNTIATSVDPQTGRISTTSGTATSDPTAPDTACFAGSQNVPLQLLERSPIFKDADFNFGGTDVGTTQYSDAFSRANFWSVIDRANYHTRFSPVQIFDAIVVNVPAKQGLSLPANIFEPSFGMCGPEGLIDANFLDAFVVKELSKLPGINPGTFPMFMIYNTGIALGNPTNLANCCAGGYHSINPAGPISFQAYSPFDFDVSGFFVPSANDTAIVSHETNEFLNDPYVINRTPSWGHVGQVGFCQDNLEVGDPLSGTNISRIVGPNGYTYNLQELAFFSWFFGNPSLGIHGWDSDNGTFLTDAGPICQ